MSKKYKPSTKIKFYCDTGFAGCIHEEVYTLEALNISCSQSDKDIEDELNTQSIEWKDNFIEHGWSIDSDE
jgi:hypothetical protein